MNYKLINVLNDGNQYDITSLVSSYRWGGDIKEAARHLEVSFAYTDDYFIKKYDVPLGSILIFYIDDIEIIRVVVFSLDKTTDKTLTVKGYDHAIYLLKNQTTKVLTKITASQFIRNICNEFGVPVGEIVDTGVPLTKIYRDKALYDQAISALTDTTTANGKKYIIKMKQGKLNTWEKAEQTIRWKIEDGVNLSQASYSESIEDMKNKIVITGEKDKVIATVQDDNLIKLYGIFTEQMSYDNATDGEVNSYANNKLKELSPVKKEASISCIGINDVEAGVAVELENSLLGLFGTFYVDNDEHTIENQNHMMSLKLRLTDDVATKLIKDANTKKKTKAQLNGNLNWNMNW